MAFGQVRIAKNQERKLRALDMRKQGIGLQEIANALGYNSMQAAHAAIKRALQDTMYEAVDEYRVVNLQRLEALLNIVWPQAVDGDLKAVLVAKELLAEISKLLGLNAPVQVQAVSVENVRVEFVDSAITNANADAGGGSQ